MTTPPLLWLTFSVLSSNMPTSLFQAAQTNSKGGREYHSQFAPGVAELTDLRLARAGALLCSIRWVAGGVVVVDTVMQSNF